MTLADPERLQQVVWNLLSNAVKFTRSGGAVDVSVGVAKDELDRQRDPTPGSASVPDFLPHVFERFRQADGSFTRAHGGLGLGLAIVRELTELHGGTVSAESDGLGRGARFTLRLPMQALSGTMAEPADDAGSQRAARAAPCSA